MRQRFRGRAPIRRHVAKGGPRRCDTPESQWFWDHYEWAANEIEKFCGDCGLSLHGLEVADIGCGDGIMALGLARRLQLGRLVAFDIVATNTEVLLERGRAEGVVSDKLPPGLEFRLSEPGRITADDNEFDFVYSWSAFEHIETPIEVLTDVRRILRPSGHFFLQLWPFYHSAKGSHLWDWFPEEFHHLTTNDRDIIAQMGESNHHPAETTSYMIREFEHLNRITLEELQRAVLAAGFDVRRIELLTAPTILTPALARYSWCDLAIGGIKFLATPRP